MLRRHNAGIGPDGSVLVTATASQTGRMDVVGITAEGGPAGSFALDLDAAEVLSAADRAGDDALVLGGSVAGAAPATGWTVVLAASLALRSGPTPLGAPIGALAADADGTTLLIAGPLEGTADVEGFGPVGSDGRRQVYAVRIPMP